MFFENLLLAFKTMKTNKMRTSLSLLGVLIGVAALVCILSLGTSAQMSMQAEFATSGVDIITITPLRYRGTQSILTEKFSTELEDSIDGIDSVIAIKKGNNYSLRYIDESAQASIIGASSTFSDFYLLDFALGSWFLQEDNIQSRQVCVIGKEIANSLFQAENPVGKYIKIYRNSAKAFYCVGVLESRDATLSIDFDNSVFIPYNTFITKLTSDSNVSNYLLHVEDGRDPVEVAENVSAYMDSLVSSDGYTIFSAATLAEIFSKSTATFYLFLAAVAAISLFVGGIGIMNIMLVSVAERTREIGIRKALGANNRTIQLQFLTESMIMTLLGGILGVILGLVITFVASIFLKWKFSPSFTSFVVAIVFSLVVGVFFGWYPSFKASKLNPIDALSHD